MHSDAFRRIHWARAHSIRLKAKISKISSSQALSRINHKRIRFKKTNHYHRSSSLSLSLALKTFESKACTSAADLLSDPQRVHLRNPKIPTAILHGRPCNAPSIKMNTRLKGWIRWKIKGISSCIMRWITRTAVTIMRPNLQRRRVIMMVPSCTLSPATGATSAACNVHVNHPATYREYLHLAKY